MMFNNDYIQSNRLIIYVLERILSYEMFDKNKIRFIWKKRVFVVVLVDFLWKLL